jgi:hypothetical protein
LPLKPLQATANTLPHGSDRTEMHTERGVVRNPG